MVDLTLQEKFELAKEERMVMAKQLQEVTSNIHTIEEEIKQNQIQIKNYKQEVQSLEEKTRAQQKKLVSLMAPSTSSLIEVDSLNSLPP